MSQEDDHDAALHDAELLVYQDRYHAIPLSAITDSALSPPPWLLGPAAPMEDGLIRQKTITMLSAEPFTGKTMLMLAMTLGLSAERDLLGYQASPGQRVAFFGQDAPTWDYHGQLSKLWKGAGAPPLKNDSLLFLNRGWRLTDPNFSSFLSETISLHGTTCLMFDTLLAFHDADENSNREMARVMDLLKSWRDNFNCAIIFSHHTSKAQGISGTYRARGASVVSGSVDFHLALAARGSTVSLGLPKRRGSSRKRAEGFTLTDTAGGGIALEPRLAGPAALDLLLSFLAIPRTQDEIFTYLSEIYGAASAASLTGRLHATLGILQRKHRVVRLADGRISVRPKHEGLSLVTGASPRDKEQPDGYPDR